ncbi:MAG TPA: hypothetical protein VFF14_11425, partial [Candidatus Deferrimicrobium sp.]|nr:hypothetical protein [Candidatus Deferrimicrobium sp.]
IIDKSINLPTSKASNLQASYAKDYLAYSDNQGLKVVNIKTSKLAFAENNPLKGEILEYRWLPDRNTLLFVLAKPNPNPKPAEPTKPIEVKNIEKEDPKTGKMVTTTTTTESTPVYYNPQVTELYAVDFADPDEEVNADKRLASKISDFPVGAKIEAIDVSTYTNLIYLQVKTASAQIMYEIDVMKNMRKVQRAGEKIANMVASDKKGTLYMQSNLSGINQIVAVKHSSREQLIKGNQYVLLGVQDNKVLVGDVQNNTLVKILSLPDTNSQEKVATTTTVEWQGSIPWKNYKAITGQNNYWVLYNDNQAVLFQQGQVSNLEITANDYLTTDGREIMKLLPNGDGTLKLTIKPL